MSIYMTWSEAADQAGRTAIEAISHLGHKTGRVILFTSDQVAAVMAEEEVPPFPADIMSASDIAEMSGVKRNIVTEKLRDDGIASRTSGGDYIVEAVYGTSLANELRNGSRPQGRPLASAEADEMVYEDDGQWRIYGHQEYDYSQRQHALWRARKLIGLEAKNGEKNV